MPRTRDETTVDIVIALVVGVVLTTAVVGCGAIAAKLFFSGSGSARGHLVVTRISLVAGVASGVAAAAFHLAKKRGGWPAAESREPPASP
ncbi:MAG TPA: hypothetical protein VLH10_10240 [Yinghuangia sp.]|uniref:hypothetical protein n=1 Tax=Yinghuangia sp. YIM S10712 TaxID=3436930 RepID=UPI002C570597|nr:hypothetical protein [Yinghuangia sp.]